MYLRKKIDIIQSQALRICGGFRTSPVASLQVEIGEMPLEFRGMQLRMVYWISINGHGEKHPVKKSWKNAGSMNIQRWKAMAGLQIKRHRMGINEIENGNK